MKMASGHNGATTSLVIPLLSQFFFLCVLNTVRAQYAPEFPTQFFSSARTGPLPGASIQEAANFVVFGSKRGFDEMNYTATERKNLRTELVSRLEKQGISTDGSIIDYDGTDPLPLDVVVDPKLGTVSITSSQNPTNASALFVPMWTDYNKLQKTITARTGDSDVDAYVYDVYETTYALIAQDGLQLPVPLGPTPPGNIAIAVTIVRWVNPKAAIPEYRIKEYAYNLASFNSADNFEFTGDPEYGNLGSGSGITAVTATSPSKNTWTFNVVQVFGTPSFTAHNRGASTFSAGIKKNATKSSAASAFAPTQSNASQAKP